MSLAPVVVLGAGPAGLGLSYRAAGRGHDVRVIEREEHVGGASASVTVAGIRVDQGSHRLHRAIDPEILAELRGLLGGDLQRRERRGRIRLADRWLPFPLTPSGTVRGLPSGLGVRAGLEALTAGLRTPTSDTFAEVVRSTLGPTMLARFYGPYAAKLWGLPPEELSGEQARRRIGASSPGAVLRRVLAGADPDRRAFLYPRRGFGQLWEAVAEAAVARGAELCTGRTAVAVHLDDGGAAVQLDDGATVEGRHLFSTIPLPVLVRLLRPDAPAHVLEAASGLRTRAMVLVYLVLDLPRYTEFDAHYLPEAWTPFTRVSEPTNYRDGHPGPDDPGDPDDRTVLCAELPCQVGDERWSSSDDDLARLLVMTLRRAGLPEPLVRSVATRRLRSAYPIYDLGYEDRLQVVDDHLRSLPALTTFGRQGLFVHDNSHHALAMAWAAADALRSDGTIDAAAWARARERFTSHVVED